MRPRPGFALLVSMLMTMALAAIGAGMLAVAVRETEIAAAMTNRARARTAAEAGVRAALADWSTRARRDMAVGELAVALAPAPDNPVLRVRRVDRSLFLLEAVATPLGTTSSATATAAVLVRTLDPDSLAAGFPAAVTADTDVRVRRGQVSGADACGRHDPVTGVTAPRVVVEPGSVVAGAPAIADGGLTPPGASDVFAAPLIGRLASWTIPGGHAEPRPRTDAGGCAPDPLNWGAIAPAATCHGLLPLVHSTDDLVIRDGEGRGAVVVDGDLHVDNVRFHGVLLVRGRLTVGPGAVLRGAVRAATVDILDGSIRYDSCAVADALTAGGLDGPFRPAERWWIPAF